MIEIINIKKKFQEQSVLKGVSISVSNNEIIAIKGESGAGKTTLLKCIGLLDDIDSGIIKVNGKDTSSLNESQKCQFRNKEVGFVFQFHNLLPEFSAIENILMPSFISKNHNENCRQYAEDLIDTLNIINIKDKRPNQISGGEQQRVAIARALINKPKIILADEPSGNLDSRQSEEMFKLFHTLRNKYSTIFLIVTHNNTLANMCDRHITLEDGKILV